MFELDIYVIVNFFFKETVFHYKKKGVHCYRSESSLADYIFFLQRTSGQQAGKTVPWHICSLRLPADVKQHGAAKEMQPLLHWEHLVVAV